MTSWKHIEHKRRPNRSMRPAVCGLGLSLSPTTNTGGKLGFEAIAVDSQTLKQ